MPTKKGAGGRQQNYKIMQNCITHHHQEKKKHKNEEMQNGKSYLTEQKTVKTNTYLKCFVKLKAHCPITCSL